MPPNKSRDKYGPKTPQSFRGIHINISTDPFPHRIPPYIQRLWQDSRLRKRLVRVKIRVRRRTVLWGCFTLLLFFWMFQWAYLKRHPYDWRDQLKASDLMANVFPDEGRSQTTAVIVLDNPTEHVEFNLNPIVNQLCLHDIFHHIVVWNDNPNVNLTLDMIHLETCTPNTFTILNSPVKMGTAARYHACQQSKTPYCYFQDIPRTSLQLKSTYANFLKSPHLIHGESSDHSSFINSHWRYCFSDPGIELHACYIDMTSGTFVARAMVSSFLMNYNKTHVVDEFADMYFTIYMNQVPYLLEGDGSYIKELSLEELNHLNTSLGQVYQDLKEQGNRVVLRPYIENTNVQRNARSACKDDRCLFLTNVEVIPSIELFTYRPPLDIKTSREMHNDYKSNFRQHHYSNVVDQNDFTSWKSNTNIKAGDYIGLDLLMPMRTRLIYRFLVQHPYSYKTNLSVQISYDGISWIRLHPPPSMSCQVLEWDHHDLLDCRFIITDTGYRYIRLESQKDHDFSFDVHDFSFSAKVKQDTTDLSIDKNLDYVEDN